MNRNDHLTPELKELLRYAGRVAEKQPGRVLAGDRAIEKPHSLVGQVQVKGPILAGLQQPQIDFARLDAQLRRLEHVAGQLGEQLIEAAATVGKARRLAGCQGEVRPTNPTEETL